MTPSADYWIEKLQLTKHVEGGSFKEIYRSNLLLQKQWLPSNFKGDRSVSTSIYFMLEEGQFSAFHRIASDEQWHFYFGGTLVIYEITPDGILTEHVLGNDPAMPDQAFQCVIRAGSWFASKPTHGSGYAITGCTVSPGFSFEDFELADRQQLVELFPQHQELIVSLTR